MQIFEEVANVLNINQKGLQRESLKIFLEKELRNIEVKIYKITNRHKIKSIFELDEKLKSGAITEEDVLDDFMELDYLEYRRDNLLKAMDKIQ